MSKKKKKTKARTQAGKAAPRRRRKRWLPIGVGVILILAAAVGYNLLGKQPTAAQLKAAAADCSQDGTRLGEHRPTLPANLFTGRAHAAYAVANAMPAVLDGLYCYCGCQESIGHKSLLSCYTDNHASYCHVCMEEAEMAAQMTAKGKCSPEIQKAIDRRFGPR